MAVSTGITTNEQFLEWGWRLPFLFSGVLVIVGILIRRSTSESPSFKRLQRSHMTQRHPAATVMKSHKRTTLRLIASQAAENTSFYALAVYSLVYLTQNLHIPRPLALKALMISAGCLFLAQPLFGALSDRIGRKKVFLGGMIFLGLFIYPFFLMLQTGNFFLIVAAMSLAMALGQGSTQAVQPSLFAEQYEAGIRYTGVSVAYQFATVLWSGPTPILAAALVAWAGNYLPLVAYIALAAVISVLAIIRLREASGVELASLEEPQPKTGISARVISENDERGGNPERLAA
jgi:MFS family permease